jgi:hypothetical protein
MIDHHDWHRHFASLQFEAQLLLYRLKNRETALIDVCPSHPEQLEIVPVFKPSPLGVNPGLSRGAAEVATSNNTARITSERMGSPAGWFS